jgi:putative NADH-flavin reductase
MNITIFGATGRTGRPLVRQALARGYEVTAFARTPSKLEVEDDALTLVQGDIREPDAVERAVQGADAVVSVLGPTGNTEANVISQGMQHIIDAMKQHDVDRLVVSVGAGVGDPKDNPKLVNRLITLALKLVAGNVYRDMKAMAKRVRESGLAWTLVRAPMLTDEPGGSEIKVGYVGEKTGPRLSREDLATFMLDQVEDDTYLHDAPVISN